MELVIFFNIKPANSINIDSKIYQTIDMPHESIVRMSLIPKVNHLAWFNGPIFHDANLGPTLPLEIPTVYS